MSSHTVTCGNCGTIYAAVFRNDPTQGYRCATTREGRVFTGHYGSEISDGTRYLLLDGHEIPTAELFCDTCIEQFIARRSIAEIVEDSMVSDDDEDGQELLKELLSGER